ncbi:carbohydrate-binding module family 1 protein [Cadophora sp. DSE1049]|nr:carbohydrate-binding module family 1 protein [Cadophora sp. DSE1049]
MLFSKVAVASMLALASSIAAQVVVTVTSTVTIVTVTVTPLSTSTSTAYVTVSGGPARTSSTSDDDWWGEWNTWRNRPTTRQATTYTSTAVVTVTVGATSAQITTCPLPVYNQCGGRDWSGCTSCTSTASCKSSNEWYYQCVPKTPRVVTVTSTIFR